tara:strand:+ start:221 stop:736 length:516 start_codon:yes stop_codon:yes gene_type:complete
LIGLSFFYLGKTAKSKTLDIDAEGYTKLRIHKFFKSFSIACLVIGVFLIIGPVIPAFPAHEKLQFGLPLFGLVFIFIFFLLWFLFQNHFLQFNQDSIEVQTLFKKRKSIQIKDIAIVKHNSITNEVVFKTKDGRKVGCSQFLVGIVNLLELIETNNDLDLKKVKLRVQFGK